MSEDFGGHLVERYIYSPYGELIVHQSTGFGDRDGDGNVNSTDKGTPGTTCTGTVSGSCRILDLDFDGGERSERERAAIGKASTTRASGPRARPEPANTKRAGGGYDSTDASKFDDLPQGLQLTPGKLATAVSQPFAHQGLLFEPEIGSYQNRARLYDPAKRRFMQRDPYQTREAINQYAALRSNPLKFYDPDGRKILDLAGELSDLLPCCAFSSDGDGYAQMSGCNCGSNYTSTLLWIISEINSDRIYIIHPQTGYFEAKICFSSGTCVIIVVPFLSYMWGKTVFPPAEHPDQAIEFYVSDLVPSSEVNPTYAHEVLGHGCPPPGGNHDEDEADRKEKSGERSVLKPAIAPHRGLHTLKC